MAYSSPRPFHKKQKKTLAWSNTRISVFEHCERKYFLSYYTFALKNEFPELRAETLLLKGLKNIDMRVGEKSHFLLSDYLHLLKKGEVTEEMISQLKDNMRSEMLADFNYSKERDYSEREDFFGKFGLLEHFNGENVDDKLEEATERVCNNLDHFIESSWNQKVQDYFNTARFVYVEHPRTPDFEAMKMNVRRIPGMDDVSVLAGPDFGVTFSDTDFLIIDWKSGKEEVLDNTISNQLKVYALKVLLKKGLTSLDGIKIEAYEVYLDSMNSYGGILKQEDIDSIIEKMQNDVKEQKQLLVDQNAYRNEPVDMMMFRKTASEKKCEACPFRSVCERLEK